MRHRHRGLSIYGLNGQRQGDEHPRLTLRGVPYLCRRTTKFDVVTHMGEGMYFGVSQPSHPKRVEFQRSSILGVLLYLRLHPFTQNDQIRHDNVTLGGACFQQVSHAIIFTQMRRAVCQQ